MRRVSFIAYDFPPGTGIGAGLRSASFVRNLPEFGWQPTVVALDTGQAPTPGVVRLPSPTPWHWPYELTPYGWAYALSRHLGACDDDVDLVYVSCPPYPQALSAARFARRRGLPLVVDFRDAWSLDPYREGSRLKKLLYRYLFPSMERRLMADTDLLILNTPSALRAYRDLYPERGGDMAWIPNGYAEEAFPAPRPLLKGDELTLLHAGRFGIGGRSPDKLLAAVGLARQQGCRVRLEILGDQSPAVRSRIQAAGLEGAVNLRGQVAYEQSVAAMCGAGVLVLVQAPTDATVQAVAGKTFDYLRAGRPVLAIGPDGDNLDLVRRHAWRHECPADTPETIAAAITRLWQDWQAGVLSASRVDPAVTARYERQALAGQLAAHFDRLVAGARQ